MTSFFITNITDGGYVVLSTHHVSAELIASNIVFAGTLIACLAYLRDKFKESG